MLFTTDQHKCLVCPACLNASDPYRSPALRYFLPCILRSADGIKIRQRKWVLSAWSCTFECTRTHTRLRPIPPVDCSLLRCPLSRSAGLVALMLQRRLTQWELGYCEASVSTAPASLGGDKDSDWLGLNESEGEDSLLSIHFFPPAGSSIFDYDHFTPDQVCTSCDGGNPVERR